MGRTTGRRRRAWLAAAAAVLIAVVAGSATFYFNPLFVNDEVIRWHLWRSHVESHEVVLETHRIHYFEAKPPARMGPGKVLVLIHGLGSRGEDWSPMIPGLTAAGFHVYAPDLLGYGRSAKPDVDYSIELEERMVMEFMDQLELQDADIGGWSMGGWIALRMAVDHPDLVDRLVVYDAAGIYFPAQFEASLFVPTDASGIAKLGQRLSPASKPIPAFISRAAVRRLQENGWVIQRAVASMEEGHDLLDFRLDENHKPVLIVWGDKDALIPLSVGQTMHKDLPGSSMLVIAGCGHLAPGECWRPVLKGTVAFLRADPPIRGSEDKVDGTR